MIEDSGQQLPEQSGSRGFPKRTPRHLVREQLRAVLNAPAPYLSLYLDLDPDRVAHTGLPVDEMRGMTDVQRHVVDRLVEERPDDQALVAAVVAADGTAASAYFPDPPAKSTASVGSLPVLAPFIESDQLLAHHVVAVLDDDESTIHLLAFPRHGEPGRESFAGGDLAGAAALVARLAIDTDTSMVIVAGAADRAMELRRRLRELLPIDVAVTSVAPADDANTVPDDPLGSIADDLVRQVADRSARRIVESMRLWRYHRAHGAAVSGVVDTIGALRAGTVGFLLVHDDPADDRQAWFGEAFAAVAVDLEDAANSIGQSEELQQGRLVDVVLRAAVGLGIPCLIVPALPDDRLADGVGAVLDSEASQLGELLER